MVETIFVYSIAGMMYYYLSTVADVASNPKVRERRRERVKTRLE